MEQKRERIKVNTSMVGSSDYRRMKAVRAILTENHTKNVSFFAAIKAEEKKEEPVITEKYILSRYSEVMIWGNWKPVSHYVGVLVFMFNNDFKFQ